MYTCHSERIIFQCVKDTATVKTDRNSLIRKKTESTSKKHRRRAVYPAENCTTLVHECFMYRMKVLY